MAELKDAKNETQDTEPVKMVRTADPVEHTVKIVVEQPEIKIEKKEARMADQEVKIDVNAETEKIRHAETMRVKDISAMGEKYSIRDLAQEYIGAGKSTDEFRAAALERMTVTPPVPMASDTGKLGMSEKEISNFSIVRAIATMAEGRWGSAGNLEREASEAYAKKIGKSSRGFFVPPDVLRQPVMRGTTLLTTPTTIGGALVATDLLSGSFIDLLMNALVVKSLGAMVLDGLQGNVAIPRQTQGATAYWITEDGAATQSNQAFDQITLGPKCVAAYTEMSRSLILQSSISIENLVRNDLARTIAAAIDLAALDGPGSGNMPRGVLHTSGIGSVASGGTLTNSNVVDLETAVSVMNAAIGNLAYITNMKVRGALKKTFSNTTYGEIPLWGPRPGALNEGELNGYRAVVTNQMPATITSDNLSALVFGNWADLILGFWGGLDFLVDPYTNSAKGTLRIVVYQDCDVAVRHAESFAACMDIDV